MKNAFEELLALMKIHRQLSPWAKQLTLKTLSEEMIQEVKEFEETLSTQDYEHMKDELGDVFIEGESMDVFNSLNIIKAIGRGFNPDIALKLLSEDYVLEVIPIEDFSRNKKDLIRIRSRLIGTEGKARKSIESLTNTSIVVYGKTVGIIGKIDNVMLARQAIINLSQGSKHGNVYLYLEKQKSKNQ